MLEKQSITAIILTYNEELHLQRCLNSIKSLCENIVVVDSFSTDSTAVIAKKNGVHFIQNKWVNYAVQFNWALKNVSITTDWVLRIDADEYLTDELQVEIVKSLPKIISPINGIVLPLKRVFLDKHIKWGLGTIMLLRLFRTGTAKSEFRWMDEHIQLLEGETIDFKNAFADHNLNNISYWTNKHIGYAIREAIELLDLEIGLLPSHKDQGYLSKQANKKRMLKYKYAKKPLFLRAFIYFLYRYFFMLGFMDGKEGFLWHFLQGWWYRTLVDVKIYEIKKRCGTDKECIKRYLNSQYEIDIQ